MTILDESNEMTLTSLSEEASTLTNGAAGGAAEYNGARYGDWPTN